MGIGIWALIALAAVLAVYLVPFLVGRQEVLGASRTEDRYSDKLRILATGAQARPAGPDCGTQEHAEIFRQRPEVRAMSGHTARSATALRLERDLERAQQAHEAGRLRRRTAASHRRLVACALLGMVLGTAVVTWMTVVPWWVCLVPGGLLALSLLAGHSATRQGRAAERRELRRIESIDSELRGLRVTFYSGERSARPVRSRSGAGRTAASARSATSAPHAASARSATSAPHAASARSATSAPHAASARSATSAPHAASAWSAEHPVSSPSAASADLSGGRPAADYSAARSAGAQGREPMTRAAERAARAGRREVTTATPPQGWHPVAVPPPTYTLAPTARRRAIAELGEEERPSASVPMRPTAARPYLPVEDEEPVRAPIDLDSVLERRRAAGA